MRLRLHEEHTPALQTFREGALEKRTEVLAQEELKIRAQLDSEMSILRGKLDQETRKACEIQKMRMIDEHRRRSEDLTHDLLHRHEKELRRQRDALTKIHQLESETVITELSEALSFGVKNALDEHASILRLNTNEKIKKMKDLSEKSKHNTLNELQNRLAVESDNAIRHLREANVAELDVCQSRLRGEFAAEHAAKVNKLQLNVQSKKSSTEKDLKNKYEIEYMNKVKMMNEKLNSDISDTLEESEILFVNKMKHDLDDKRQLGEKKQQNLLIQLERSFQVELKQMVVMMERFFGNDGTEYEPSSPKSNERHMPTTKRAIQERLHAMTEQFEMYKNRYKRAAKDLTFLQNEIIDLRQKLRNTLRLLENEKKKNDDGSHRFSSSSMMVRAASPHQSRQEMEKSVHDLYQSNVRLIERVTGRR
jgi:hypothetical protein